MFCLRTSVLSDRIKCKASVPGSRCGFGRLTVVVAGVLWLSFVVVFVVCVVVWLLVVVMWSAPTSWAAYSDVGFFPAVWTALCRKIGVIKQIGAERKEISMSVDVNAQMRVSGTLQWCNVTGKLLT